jgi:hypothetical protein
LAKAGRTHPHGSLHSRAGRRAIEMLNRYIDGGRKRDPTTDLQWH